VLLGPYASTREATDKAKELLQMIVAKSRCLKALKEPVSEVKRKGSSSAAALGMRAALGLAQQGFDCAVVERKGSWEEPPHIHYTLEGNDVQALLRRTEKAVREIPTFRFSQTQR